MRGIGCLLLLAAAVASGAQLKPGNILISDTAGNIWQLDVQGNVTSLINLPGQPIYGLDVTYSGDILAGGAGVVWRITPAGTTQTVRLGSPLTSLQGDVEVNQRGNFYVTSMGVNTLWEMDFQGTVVTQYAMTGSTRTWGIGIDRADQNRVYVAGLTVIHKLDPVTGRVQNIRSGVPFTFLQGALFGPNRTFVVGDQNSKAVYEITPTGTLFTLYAGAPLGDAGEGMDVLPDGRYVVVDDGSPGGTVRNAVFLLQPGAPPTITTLAQGSPFSDLNGCAVIPALFVKRITSNPAPGGSVQFSVTSAGAAMDPYIFVASFSALRGFPLPGGKRFPLDPDDLLILTLQNLLSVWFLNFQGLLDPAGQAALQINVPKIAALKGVTLHVAGVTLNPNAPAGIHLVSNVATTTIQ